MCISPWADIGFSQVNALSMRWGLPFSSSSRSLGAAREAQVRAIQRGSGTAVAVRGGVGLNRFGVGRFEAEAAGHLDGAQEDLQHMQRAAGLEAVRVRRHPAHRVHRHRAAGHLGVCLTAEVGPFDIQLKRLVKGDPGQFAGDGADALGWDAAFVGNGLGRVVRRQVAFRHQVEDRPVGDAIASRKRLSGPGAHRAGRRE